MALMTGLLSIAGKWTEHLPWIMMLEYNVRINSNVSFDYATAFLKVLSLLTSIVIIIAIVVLVVIVV